MAVKFTTLIKMDMDRDTEREMFMEGKLGELVEDNMILDYRIEIPCKVNKQANDTLIQALSKKFQEEEDSFRVTIIDGKNCFDVHSSYTEFYESIEDLYDVAKLYVEYLGGILEEHSVQECTLILELGTDMILYPYQY